VSGGWRQRAAGVRRDTLALYVACRDPRVPRHVKLLAGCVVAYALSPIDLIPDFIPVLGYLGDLVVVPLGLLLVREADSRGAAREASSRRGIEACGGNAAQLGSAPRS
jgi:uncharacterized membrane protein YkvA (DUF1232 family)